MSGGKGGSTTSQVEIPQYIEEASKKNLAVAGDIAQLGYTPYYGPDVAAFSPMQEAAFQGTSQAASAFGMPTGQMAQPQAGMTPYGMPQPQTYAGGMRGYSSAPIYEQSLQALQQNAPAQFDFIRSMFINPQTGERPKAPFGEGGSIYEKPADDGSNNGGSNNSGTTTQSVGSFGPVTKMEKSMGLTQKMKDAGMTIADLR